MIAIITGEFNILILRKYSLKICAISFGFWASYLKVYIHLPWIKTQQWKTPSFSSRSLLTRMSLIYWYYKNTVLRFVWYCLVFIQLNLKVVSIYPESTHSNEQHQHSKSLLPYHLGTSEQQEYIWGSPIFVKDIITPI